MEEAQAARSAEWDQLHRWVEELEARLGDGRPTRERRPRPGATRGRGPARPDGRRAARLGGRIGSGSRRSSPPSASGSTRRRPHAGDPALRRSREENRRLRDECRRLAAPEAKAPAAPGSRLRTRDRTRTGPQSARLGPRRPPATSGSGTRRSCAGATREAGAGDAPDLRRRPVAERAGPAPSASTSANSTSARSRSARSGSSPPGSRGSGNVPGPVDDPKHHRRDPAEPPPCCPEPTTRATGRIDGEPDPARALEPSAVAESLERIRACVHRWLDRIEGLAAERPGPGRDPDEAIALQIRALEEQRDALQDELRRRDREWEGRLEALEHDRRLLAEAWEQLEREQVAALSAARAPRPGACRPSPRRRRRSDGRRPARERRRSHGHPPVRGAPKGCPPQRPRPDPFSRRDRPTDPPRPRPSRGPVMSLKMRPQPDPTRPGWAARLLGGGTPAPGDPPRPRAPVRPPRARPSAASSRN